MPKNKRQFVNLHVHSDKSLLDGMSKVGKLVELAVQDESPGLALTNHKNIADTIQLFKHCKAAGINPIPGLEGYFVEDVNKVERQKGVKHRYHSIFLAHSTQGLKNLTKMTSVSHQHMDGDFPLVDWDIMSRYSEGLISTTACIGGHFNQLMLRGEEKAAYESVSRSVDIFGKDKFFVELQDHGIEEEKQLIPELMRLSKKMGLKTIVTGDSHYNEQDDARAHDAILCISSGGKTIYDENRFRFSSDQNYFHTAEMAYRLFPEEDFPGAVSNTLLVNEMVSVDDPRDSGHLLPKYPYLEDSETSMDHLRKLCYAGAKKLCSDVTGHVPQSVIDRFEYELDVIEGQGFPDYFLIVSDIVRWCRYRGIPVGPGRGSAAGSMVSFLIEITSVNPLPFGLWFERFLNPDRNEMPDIDLDIDSTRRDEVLAYIVQRFGQENVAQICAWQTLKGLSSIKDSARVLGYPIDKALEAKAAYPSMKESITIKEMLDEEPELTKESSTKEEKKHRAWKESASLRRAYDDDDSLAEIFDLAGEIEGTTRAIGKHAAGVLITPGDVSDYFPVFNKGDNGVVRSQYDKYDVEDAGGLKLDLLGLSNLSVVEGAVRLIKTDLNKTISPYNLPLDDPEVFKMLAGGEVATVFQVASPGLAQLLKDMKTDKFGDLSAAIALYRPGPMSSDLHNEYARRKTGKSKVSSLHPKLSEILKDTYSVLVYQEQVMRVSQVFAGFSGAEADRFRSAMGKKKPEVMAEMKEKFTNGCIDNGFTESLATSLWNQIEPFSGYAFNQSHTVSYALVSYATAYLKCHYTAQYLAAYIDSSLSRKHPEEMNGLISYAGSKGIEIFSPDINKSKSGASTSGGNIWLGLSRVRFCNPNIVHSIIQARNSGGNFTSLGNFIERTRPYGVRPLAVTNLVYAGAFDHLHSSRKAMVEAIPEMVKIADRMGSSFDDEDSDDFDIFADVTQNMTSAIEDFDLDGEDYSRKERRSLEFSALEMFTGTHPFAEIEPLVPQLVSMKRLPSNAIACDDPRIDDHNSGDKVSIYGVVGSIESKTSKKTKKAYSRFSIETKFGSSLDVVFFKGSIPEELRGSLICVEGTIKLDRREFEADDAGDGDDELGGVTEIQIIREVVATKYTEIDTDLSERSIRRSRLKVVEDEGDGGKESAPKPKRKADAPEADSDKPKRRRITAHMKTSGAPEADSDKPTENTSAEKPASIGKKTAKKASKRSAPRERPESRRQGSAGGDGTSRVLRLSDSSRVTFIARSEDDLVTIKSHLDECGSGITTVYVDFNGKRWTIGEGWGLSRAKAREIADKTGITLKLPRVKKGA